MEKWRVWYQKYTTDRELVAHGVLAGEFDSMSDAIDYTKNSEEIAEEIGLKCNEYTVMKFGQTDPWESGDDMDFQIEF